MLLFVSQMWQYVDVVMYLYMYSKYETTYLNGSMG